ncbi:hypothetical protein MKX03_034864 [Papaver bracteatum]|nr:hypothetical protein MKX03_034864 [Papaver bracteatum]
MSSPLRKMGSQFRRLDTNFISARNFSSNWVAEEVPDKYIKLKVVAVGGTVGLSIALFSQKLIHGRVLNILGFPVGKE